MKKLLVLTMVSVTLFSCSSNENKLLSKLENHLKVNLKDPSSYELIESKLDTSFKVENLKNSISSLEESIKENESYLKIYEGEEKISYQEKIDYEKNLIKENEDEISKTDKNEIQLIVGVFKYRTKNGFGALGIMTSKVLYAPKNDKITAIY